MNPPDTPTRTLYYATSNAAKVSTLRAYLDPVRVHVEQRPMPFLEPQSQDIRAIARAKAQSAYEQLRLPVVANDSGLYLPAWSGWPAALTEPTIKMIGTDGLLKMLEGKKGKERECEFRECIALIEEEGYHFEFIGVHPGSIAHEARGTYHDGFDWSVLSQLFIPRGHDKTLSEMDAAERQQRRAAFEPAESAELRLRDHLTQYHGP